MTIPAWKAFEDRKVKEAEEKEVQLALEYLIFWLDEQKIAFSAGRKGNLINIHSNVLISRKEIEKILRLTRGMLGVQFHEGEIGIYQLYTKIKK